MEIKEAGLFITVEGGEGSGKSTLIKKIFNYLNDLLGTEIIKTFEPGATALGKKIREILLRDEQIALNQKSELFLFLADRAQHVESVIRPALERGLVVLCDRYNDSSIAYQGAARLQDSIKDIEKICHFATNNLEPHITFYLDIDPEAGLARVQGTLDRLEKEKIEFHRSVREGFLMLANKNQERICVVDASQEEQEVFAFVKTTLAKRLNNYV